MARIFISYRRADTAGHVDRLRERLSRRYGEAGSFVDINDIPPGEDFVAAIDDALKDAQIALIIIGPRWLDIRNDAGSRRLLDPRDHVRREVEAALASDLDVIPVLLDDAQMPDMNDLPPSLAQLARRQAFSLGRRDYEIAIRRLYQIIDSKIGRPRSPLWHRAVALTGIVLILMVAGYGLYPGVIRLANLPHRWSTADSPPGRPPEMADGPDQPSDAASPPPGMARRLLDERFSQDSATFWEAQDAQTSYLRLGGTYMMRRMPKARDTILLRDVAYDLDDGSLTMDVRLAGDAHNRQFVLECRQVLDQNDRESGYRVLFEPATARVTLARISRHTWQVLQDWTTSDAIDQSDDGRRTNRIELRCDGPSITVRVNDNPLPIIQQQDTETDIVRGTWWIGVFAPPSVNDAVTEAWFDNIRLYGR